MLILPGRLPARSFLLSLAEKDCARVLRACLLVLSVTRGRIVPHQGQLEAGLAALTPGNEISVIARTGWGKTLCIALPLLLQPDTITLTISPLKRLQKMQVKDFINKFGIPTLAVNEDTPNSPELWNAIESGAIRHLVVQPEQLRIHHGHLPRMAKLLQNRAFVSKIKRVAVDEAHNIYTAGSVINNRPAFRPAWGALGELRARLSKDTSFLALSATMPSYIHRSIQHSLGFKPDSRIIRVSINRPNIIYATHRLVDGPNNLRNLDCIIPQPFHPPMRLPKLVIFHGVKIDTATHAEYANSRLPPALQGLRICRHYHGDMSPEYLGETYNSFADPDGGLDVPEIDGVINYGLPEKVPMCFQWEGRAGRSTSPDAFALTMVEPWVYDMDLNDAVDDNNDPDRPLLSDGLTKKHPRKQERVGTASVRLARCESCKRSAYAKFFEDTDAEALDFTCLWCCDGHPGNGFSLSTLFLGPIYEGTVKTVSKRTRNKYRKVSDRVGLSKLLTDWVSRTHSSSPLRFLRPPSFILDKEGLKTITMALPSTVTSTGSIISLLKQSDEWGRDYATPIHRIIQQYDGSNRGKAAGDEDDSEEDEGPPLKRGRIGGV
ncbi:P-loop containing nucleoside triphosphate hydrolase protein [Mycena filopes]|nr:P-loop containing nucleoside triphosphate hydrolase protein [Mycena filopes]